MHVFISGNIGAGKSTVLAALADRCGADPQWTVVAEPADAWAKTGLLAAMYEGTLSPGEFQIMALVSRVTGLLRAASTSFVLAERSPWEDAHVFAATTLDGIHRTNYDFAHDQLMRTLDTSPAQLVHIILEVTPVVAMSRICSRSRPGEQSVTPEYLASLNDAYATFSPPGTVHRIDANGTETATLAAIAAACGALPAE
jgi:deoxyadenosine/deoxycytidine kinase